MMIAKILGRKWIFDPRMEMISHVLALQKQLIFSLLLIWHVSNYYERFKRNMG